MFVELSEYNNSINGTYFGRAFKFFAGDYSCDAWLIKIAKNAGVRILITVSSASELNNATEQLGALWMCSLMIFLFCSD